MVAGTSRIRTTVASTISATIMPTPISLMNVIPEVENAPITMTSSSAALVITPPVRCRPLATAAVLSPVTSYRFLVGTAPHVASAQYPENVFAGGAGIEGTFEFSGGTAGIVSFDYQFDGAATTTAPADSAGRASATFTPAANFEQHTLVVTGHLADGTPTDTTEYFFFVGGGQ